MRPRGIAVLLVSILLSTTAHTAVAGSPAGIEVQALDDYFLPSLSSVGRGGTVVWTFGVAERSHTATDRSGMGLFDSGIVSPGGPSFSYRFEAAGSYPYTCTIHMDEMNGRVNVPIRAWPRTGRLGRTIRVRWATTPAEEGFVYDVQVRGPGGRWATWLSDVDVARAKFEPTSEGVFRFRSRLRRSSGGQSDWSEASSVEIGRTDVRL